MTAVLATSHGPLGYVARVTGGARSDEILPLVVAMHGHGRSASPSLFEDLHTPARVLSLRAPIDEGEGRAWFVLHFGFDRAMRDLEALLPRVSATSAARRALTPPPAGRSSQGAMIAYGMAVRRPHEIAAAFPVSGALMPPFVPSARQEVAPICAFHGTRDEVIAASEDQRSIEPLAAIGADVELTLVPGAPHWMTRAMRRAAFDVMDPYVRREAGSSTPTSRP